MMAGSGRKARLEDMGRSSSFSNLLERAACTAAVRAPGGGRRGRGGGGKEERRRREGEREEGGKEERRRREGRGEGWRRGGDINGILAKNTMISSIQWRTCDILQMTMHTCDRHTHTIASPHLTKGGIH